MLKNVHIPVGFMTASYFMMEQSDIRQTVFGIAAAYMAATFPDLDLLDERGKSNTAEIKEAIEKACPMFLLWYAYIASSVINGVNMESIEGLRKALAGYGLIMVLKLVGWFTCVLVTVMSSHRGWSHFLLWAVVVTFSFWLIIPDDVIAGWFFWSIISHDVIDLLNKKPVKILFPIPIGFRLGICEADSWLSNLIGSIATAVFTILIYRRFI